MSRVAVAAAEKSPAPIAIFAYRRPTHLERLLQSLSAADLFEDSPVFVFCDGARDRTELEEVEKTRAVARHRLGIRAQLIESHENLGLAQSVIQGVTRLCRQFGRVIVFEDDLIVHPHSLHFLNEALHRFAGDSRVCHINAYRYPLPPAAAPCFSRLPSSWGWATWQRAWVDFVTDADILAQRISDAGLVRQMDFDGSFPYFRMLQNQARGRINSWAIRWYASALLGGALALCPSASQAANLGLDSSGVHCGVSSEYDVELGRSSEAWPREITEDPEHFRQMRQFFRGIRPSLRQRILLRVSRTVAAVKPGGWI